MVKPHLFCRIILSFLLILFLFFAEMSADHNIKSSQLNGHTMRLYVPQVPTQRIHVESILPEAESFIQNGILIREIIMTHDTMMTPVNTGITETHMSRIFGSTATCRESVKGKESDLKRIMNETTVDEQLNTIKAHPIHIVLLVLLPPHHFLNDLPVTLNIIFTAAHLSEVAAAAHFHHHDLKSQIKLVWRGTIGVKNLRKTNQFLRQSVEMEEKKTGVLDVRKKETRTGLRSKSWGNWNLHPLLFHHHTQTLSLTETPAQRLS